ncbi:putative pectinesterase 29 [Cardamine amara subsp. amara]|uniref:pectinesterase n=1 Tax=Cardamine amara subsp. amara TaxID=228776 RepID=A0ABD1BVC6_CARAN
MKSLKSILTLSFLFLTAISSFVCSDGLELKDFKEDVVKTVVVSPNGAANFKTIQDAIDYIPSGNKNWIKIILSPGIYNEKIVIPKEKQKIIMQGNNASEVIIQYNNDAGLSNASAVIVDAEYFAAINITFKNANCSKSTPIIPKEEVKVAPSIILMADKAWFYGCNFISVQDTLADKVGRHYFKNCYIEGAIDFIWGSGQSIYQNCVIHVRGLTSKGGEMLTGFITAQGRESEQDKSGFVFKNCVINGNGMASLGRAYRGYSRVLFYKTNMSNVIVAQGWDAWKHKGHEDKITYAEVKCTGEGANKEKRVKWEKNLPPKEIKFLIDPKTFIDEDGWMGSLPSSLVSLL